MAEEKKKAALSYGSIPSRAAFHSDLSADLRVLVAIASMDRMSAVGAGNAQPCIASVRTLSALTGVPYTYCSEIITKLVKAGLVERIRHPLSHRMHALRLIYLESDKPVFDKALKAAMGIVISDISETIEPGVVSDIPEMRTVLNSDGTEMRTVLISDRKTVSHCNSSRSSGGKRKEKVKDREKVKDTGSRAFPTPKTKQSESETTAGASRVCQVAAAGRDLKAWFRLFMEHFPDRPSNGGKSGDEVRARAVFERVVRTGKATVYELVAAAFAYNVDTHDAEGTISKVTMLPSNWLRGERWRAECDRLREDERRRDPEQVAADIAVDVQFGAVLSICETVVAQPEVAEPLVAHLDLPAMHEKKTAEIVARKAAQEAPRPPVRKVGPPDWSDGELDEIPW